MVQQGQTIELTRRGPNGERLWAYRYRAGDGRRPRHQGAEPTVAPARVCGLSATDNISVTPCPAAWELANAGSGWLDHDHGAFGELLLDHREAASKTCYSAMLGAPLAGERGQSLVVLRAGWTVA